MEDQGHTGLGELVMSECSFSNEKLIAVTVFFHIIFVLKKVRTHRTDALFMRYAERNAVFVQTCVRDGLYSLNARNYSSYTHLKIKCVTFQSGFLNVCY